MKKLFEFVVVFLLIPIIDYVWLAKVMSRFYLSELGSLARTENGVFSPLIWPAIGVYVALAAGIVIFVLPKAQGSLVYACLYGACIGLVIYGVYDLTNLSLIQNWPLKMTFVDLVWGGVLCALVSTITCALSEKIFGSQ